MAGDWALTEPLPGTVLLDRGRAQGFSGGRKPDRPGPSGRDPLAASGPGRNRFLEDVGEKLYRLDRALTHLLAAGFFSGCRGVVLGGFPGNGLRARPGDGPGAAGRAGGQRSGPDCPFGHGLENAALLVGGQAEIIPEEGALRPLTRDTLQDVGQDGGQNA